MISQNKAVARNISTSYIELMKRTGGKCAAKKVSFSPCVFVRAFFERHSKTSTQKHRGQSSFLSFSNAPALVHGKVKSIPMLMSQEINQNVATAKQPLLKRTLGGIRIH